MPRAPSLRSLFLAWVCFSIAFSTVFQAFLTTYLVDSGYKTPIQSVDELFTSGMKLADGAWANSFFDISNETEVSNMRRNDANCPSPEICFNWAKYHKNVSVLFSDFSFETSYINGSLSGENGEPLLCKVNDGVLFITEFVMLMFYGDPLLKRINDIFYRVVEACLYNDWISLLLNGERIRHQKIAIVHPLDEYYSFSLYHMQPAFYLLLMGLCLSVFCFVFEVVCFRLLNKGR
jgi:hypothetical protein